jgi:multidrug efflux pump
MKSFIHYFIRNPIVAFIIIVMLAILGVYAYTALPITALPPLHITNIEIDTYYSGGSPSFMEKSVSTPLEQDLNGIPDVKTIRSESEYGASFIHIVLKPQADLSQTMQTIQAALAAAKGDLPHNVSTPEVSMNTGSSADTLMILGIYAHGASALQVSEYVDRYIKPKLEAIDGVARIAEQGSIKPAARVWLNPSMLHQYNLTASDVMDAVNNANQDFPGGLIANKQKAYSLAISSRPENIKQLSHIVIKYGQQDSPILLKDVATIQLGGKTPESKVTVDGHPGLTLSITPNVNANYVGVAQNIQSLLKKMSASFPPGLKVVPIINSAHYIQHATHEIYKAIIEAAILVALVVFLFVGSLRLSLIPMVTIPICLITSMLLLKMMGYGINIMTLLALVLAIGLIIDDAIVVLENSCRHVQLGKTPAEAALAGTNEIAFAIIAMTCTLAVVYMPIALVHGFTGDLIKPFVFTLASLVILSGLLSLTVTPVMCKALIPAQLKSEKKSKFFEGAQHYYHQVLKWAIKFRWLVMALLLAILFLGVCLLEKLPSVLLPAENYSTINSAVRVPQNASPDYIDHALKQLSGVYASVPQTGHYYTINNYGDHTYEAFYAVSPLQKKPWSSDQISQLLNDKTNHFISFQTENIPYELIGSDASSADLRLELTAPTSYKGLYGITQHFMQGIQTLPGIGITQTYLHFDNQTMTVNVNEQQANDLGLSKSSIAQAISLFYGEAEADNTFIYNGQPYPILLSLPEQYKLNTDAFHQLWLASDLSHQLVLASAVLSTQSSAQPYLLNHYNGIRSAIVRARVQPGFDMAKVMRSVEGYARAHLPANASLNWEGGSLQFLQANHNLESLLILGLLCIYLVLTLQFKSFIDPFIILLTVPLSFCGAILALWLTGGSLNIYTQVGLLTLMGLITKHGILITDFANIGLEKGLSIKEAAIHAAMIRFRPILMTTFAMILGALPLALLSGSGTNALHQMAWVIIGGMLFGSMLSLFAVPVVFTLLSRFKKLKKQPV